MMVFVGWQCVVSLIIQGTLNSKHPYVCPDSSNYVYILNIWSVYIISLADGVSTIEDDGNIAMLLNNLNFRINMDIIHCSDVPT